MVNSSVAAMIGPGRMRELADRQAGHVVHAVDLGDAEALHHAVLDHLVAAAAAFFGRLEDHGHRAGEIARLGEIFRGAEQHGGVAVMAAGVHLAGNASRHRACRSSRVIGSASMSARRPTVRPAPSLPLMMPTTPVRPMPVTTSSQPNSSSFLGDEVGRLEHVEAEFRRSGAYGGAIR